MQGRRSRARRITVLRGDDVFSGDWEFGPSSSGYSVRGGLRLMKYLGIEGGVQRIRNVKWTEPFSAVPGVPGFFESQVAFDATAEQIVVVGILPFARIWEGYIKGGIGSYRFDGQQALSSLTGGPPLTRPVSTHGANLPLAVGVSVAIGRSWHLALEISSMEIDESFLGISSNDSASLGGWSLGAEYRFGRKVSNGDAQR